MIKLTPIQREYIRDNIKKLWTGESIDFCNLRTRRNLKKKNILDSSGKFTRYFVRKLIKLNKIDVYGSEKVRFLVFDPIYLAYHSCWEKLDEVRNKYFKSELTFPEYDHWYRKHSDLKNESFCIRNVIDKSFKKENIHIPTRLREASD